LIFKKTPQNKQDIVKSLSKEEVQRFGLLESKNYLNFPAKTQLLFEPEQPAPNVCSWNNKRKPDNAKNDCQ
jgi:hypothetical protein